MEDGRCGAEGGDLFVGVGAVGGRDGWGGVGVTTGAREGVMSRTWYDRWASGSRRFYVKLFLISYGASFRGQ